MTTIFDPSIYERLPQLPDTAGLTAKPQTQKITGEIMLPSFVEPLDASLTPPTV